ncbi:MAG: dicarboxylate/amino acid:cation symporter, partial [Cyanobacteria bacterium HKST-UBA01]|nr:dicarboxylate/amino acid:cation symporter [Cyanobacteria bacterium HKST-UBA01]
KNNPDIAKVFKDIIVGLVPKNLFKAMVNTDLLPIILFSLVFGAVVTTIGERGSVVIQFFQGANDAIMKIVDLLMLCAPVGILALIAGRLGEAGGLVEFMEELTSLGKYAATVMTGLGIFSIIVLPLILYFLGKPKVGVWKYFTGMWAALLTAFSTASSAAALPITMESTIENGVARRNANFVLPLGTTLNMNGTALYEAVAAVFIAQISGIELTNVHMILIATTASLAAVGAASIPEAGLVTMLIVLKAAGLPTENVSLILIIDWFLDRCRTAVNVWGDAVGACVVDRFEPTADLDVDVETEEAVAVKEE